MPSVRKVTSIKTPGFTSRDRLALAVASGACERSVAKWLRGEMLQQAVHDRICAAARELGIVRPCDRGRS